MIFFAFKIKELRILKQLLYKLIYKRELILIMNYKSHNRMITKRSEILPFNIIILNGSIPLALDYSNTI